MLEQTFRWWLSIEIVGLLALPLALQLFHSLPGRGIAFAKPAGLLLAGYLFWLALTAHLLPNRPGSIIWVLLLITAIDAVILRRGWPEFRDVLKQRVGYFIAVEVIFFAGLFLAAHIRSYVPEITGTEKPMDFLFLNSASRSTYYPPGDPWLAGYNVSYYYFGYVIQAMIGKLSGVSTAVAFNLGLAGTAALAATAAFGVGFEIVSALRRVSFRTALGVGVAAIILVTIIGNLEGVLEFGAANGDLPAGVADAADVAGLKNAPQSNSCLLPVVCIKYPTDSTSYWWWWRATRISPDAGTITEFPFFSFILGDLHPHVMAIPFVLTALGVGLAFWRADGPLGLETWRRSPPLLLLLSILIGGLGFLNTWDLPTFGFLLALLVVAHNARGSPSLREALRSSAGFLAPLVLLSATLYAPFYFGFSSQASGLGSVTSGGTRPVQSLLFWGPLAAISLPLPFFLLWSDSQARSNRRVAWASLLPLTLLACWALLSLFNGESIGDAFAARGWNWFTALFFGTALMVSLLALWRAFEKHDDDNGALLVPVLAALSVALLLIFGAEFFFVRDVFGSRLNSVFKLYYQAWLLLAVAGAAGAWWLFDHLRTEEGPALEVFRGALAGVVGLAVVGALLYPLGATLSRTGGLSSQTRTLDGLAYAARDAQMSSDLAAVNWLRQRAQPNEVLVEATGNEYSVAGRISAWTGIPTLLGWRGHEVQWGRDAGTLQQRAQDVQAIYNSTSLADAMAVLRKYGVTYVIVGSVERATYPPAALQKFESGLQSVFTHGNTTVYRLPLTAGPESEPSSAQRP